MMKAMAPMLDDIRQAVLKSGRTRADIAREVQLSETHFSQFMSGGKGLSVEAAERLAACLGLAVVVKPKRHRKGR